MTSPCQLHAEAAFHRLCSFVIAACPRQPGKLRWNNDAEGSSLLSGLPHSAQLTNNQPCFWSDHVVYIKPRPNHTSNSKTEPIILELCSMPMPLKAVPSILIMPE